MQSAYFNEQITLPNVEFLCARYIGCLTKVLQRRLKTYQRVYKHRVAPRKNAASVRVKTRERSVMCVRRARCIFLPRWSPVCGRRFSYIRVCARVRSLRAFASAISLLFTKLAYFGKNFGAHLDARESQKGAKSHFNLNTRDGAYRCVYDKDGY